MTYDIDVMVKLESKNISKIVRQLIEWGYKLKIPIKPAELEDIEKLKK